MVNNVSNSSCLPDEAGKQLCIIDQSKWFLLILIVAVILSYYTVDIQRKQLVCSVTDPQLCKCLPKTFPLQAVTGLMTLAALVFFEKLSCYNVTQAQTPSAVRENKWNHLASILVLAAAAIRFGILLQGDTRLDS